MSEHSRLRYFDRNVRNTYAIELATMAGDEHASENEINNKNCRYCKKIVATTVVKCSVCSSVFHPSCALRVAGLVVIGYVSNSNIVKCCESEIMSTEKTNPSTNDLLSAKEEIIKSKDFIITELKSKEAILMDNINLLREKVNSISSKAINPANTGNMTSKTSKMSNGSSNPQSTRTDRTLLPVANQLPALNASKIQSKPNLNPHNNNNKQFNQNNVIDKKAVNASILQAQVANRMQELINLEEDTEPKPNQVANHNMGGWQIVGGRRRGRKFMVGNNNETTNNIQTIPRYVSLHVTRLAPGTNPAVLQSILQPIFKDVKCEEHTSKHPEVYKSMKVTIRKEELQKAWKREIWPNGALISFFRTKRVLSNIPDPQ